MFIESENFLFLLNLALKIRIWIEVIIILKWKLLTRNTTYKEIGNFMNRYSASYTQNIWKHTLNSCFMGTKRRNSIFLCCQKNRKDLKTQTFKISQKTDILWLCFYLYLEIRWAFNKKTNRQLKKYVPSGRIRDF